MADSSMMRTPSQMSRSVQSVSGIIREKALHALNDEVPHGIAVGIDRMKTRKTKSGSIIIYGCYNCLRARLT